MRVVFTIVLDEVDGDVAERQLATTRMALEDTVVEEWPAGAGDPGPAVCTVAIQDAPREPSRG